MKLTEGTASFPYGGYHRIDLEDSQRAVLPKGQCYSVIVNEKTPSGMDYYTYSVGQKDGSEASEYLGYHMNAVVNPGESFLKAAGAWLDLSDQRLQQAILNDPSGEYVMDNFQIKSYLEPVLIDDLVFRAYLMVSNWSQGTPDTFTFTTEDGPPSPLTLVSEFRGAKAGDPAIETDITWTSSDPNIFTVEANSDNGSQATVTVTGKVGVAYLTVDAGEFGKRIVGIEMAPPDLTKDYIGGLKVKKNRKLQVRLAKQFNIIKYPKISTTLTGLKKGKRYQVRSRNYTIYDGTTYYSEWSDVRTSGKIR